MWQVRRGRGKESGGSVCVEMRGEEKSIGKCKALYGECSSEGGVWRVEEAQRAVTKIILKWNLAE